MSNFKNHNIDFSRKKNDMKNLKYSYERTISLKEFLPIFIVLFFIFTSIAIPSNIDFAPIVLISGIIFWTILFIQYTYRFIKYKSIADLGLSLLYLILSLSFVSIKMFLFSN